MLRDATEVAAAVGTDSYYRLTADVNAKLSDSSALRVVALGHENKSTRDVIESKRYGINPSLRIGIGSDTEITASLMLQRNRETPDYGFPLLKFDGQLSKPIDAPANRYYGFTDDKFDQDVNNLNLNIQHRINETATLTNLSQYTTYHTVASPTPLGGLVNPVSGATVPVTASLPVDTSLDSLYVIRQQRDREINDSSLYNQTYLTLVIPAAMTHTLLAGVDVGRDQYHNDTFARTNTTFTASPLSNVSPLPAVNLGNPVYQEKPALSATVVRVRTQQTDATASSTGIYVNDQLDITSQWKLVVGLRWDHFEVRQQQLAFNYYPTNSGPIAATPAIAMTSLQHSDNMLSQRAGVIWQPDEKQSYYVSYGTSFNPSGEAVTLSTTNADLDPEKNRSFEIGSKISAFNNALLLTGAVFRVEKTNARTTDPTIASVQTLGGLVRVDGFELGVTGKITDNWQVLAGYSFLDGKIVSSNDVGTGISLNIRAEGQVPQNTPRHNATAWTTYRFAKNWEVGGGAVYASQRFVNNFGTAAIDGYVRGDLTAAYVQKKFDVRVNVLNLTDKVYFETASGGRATPATGRQVVARFAYRFD
jgi:catecholate siderophore receptor